MKAVTVPTSSRHINGITHADLFVWVWIMVLDYRTDDAMQEFS